MTCWLCWLSGELLERLTTPFQVLYLYTAFLFASGMDAFKLIFGRYESKKRPTRGVKKTKSFQQLRLYGQTKILQ